MASGSGSPAPPAPRWQRLERDERRGQILAAAARLYSSRPYATVSMGDIAAAAGVTRGLVNHHFGAKRDLYLAVVRELVAVEVPVRRGSDAWRASVAAWLDLIEANRDMWLVAIGAGETGRDAELHGILDEARELTATRVLEALGRDGEAEPAEVRAMVRCFGALAEEATREWLDRGRLRRDQVEVLLVRSLPLLLERLLDDVVAAGGPDAGT